MQVIPHVYYSLEATDLILPSDMKKRKENGLSLKNISAAADKREDPFDAGFIMGNEEKKQKTKSELITSVQDFCHRLHDFSDDYTALPYNRPTYAIKMRRNATVHIFDNNLGGVSITNSLDIRGINDGIFNFIYNRANEMIYASNIRQVLGLDLKYLRIYDIGEMNHISFDRVSKRINPATTPLYVYKIDVDKDWGLEAFVKIISDNTVVVNDKMREIHPKVTGRIPAHMSVLFKNKTEPIKRAYSKGFWYKKSRLR